ncbi:MAG: hypothetical protein R3F61_17285 [Myxococcota bacterium]
MRLLPLVLLLACTGPEEDLEPIERCGSAQLADAPPPADTAFGPVAPVDLNQVSAQVEVRADGLGVDATATFLTDDADAIAVLELRPDVEAWLDDAPVELERITVGDPAREVVGLGVLDPCSEHTLSVRATLPVGWMSDEGDAARIESTDDGVFWAAGLEDDTPGHFLSMWMPGNLLFDRFDLALDLEVSALDAPHELAATGTVTDTAVGWRVEWSDIQSHTPFWVVSPTAITQRRSAVVPLPEGDVTLEVRSLTTDPGADPDEALTRGSAALQHHAGLFGPYGHGDRYVLWIRQDHASSMEYDGATLTQMGAIEHEMMHSWYARGASPVADLHGWVDEAITSWVTDLFPLREVPLDRSLDPRVLQIGTDEWAGASLSTDTYVYGSSVFADIASRHGTEAVVEALRVFYVQHLHASYRSTDLERHLTCWFDDDEVRTAFRHTGYGLEGPPDPRPWGWCQ